MFEILQYPFMQRALLAGIFLAGILTVLGIFVLLRKMSFFADGIAHASLAGIAIGIIFSWYPLFTALFLSALFALIIYFIEKKSQLATDTAIGIIFTSGMALGVLIISLQPGYQPELFSFLFGDILAIQNSDLILIGIIGFFISIFTILHFKNLTMLALDEDLAYASGIKTNIIQPIFYVMLALTVVLGVKILGAILVSALLILPTASALNISSSLKRLIIYSIILAEIIMVSGVVTSALLDLPTGPTVILAGTTCFIATLLGQAFIKK